MLHVDTVNRSVFCWCSIQQVPEIGYAKGAETILSRPSGFPLKEGDGGRLFLLLKQRKKT
jgi:hypothetical protein